MIVAGAILLVMSSLYRKQCEKKPVSAVPWERPCARCSARSPRLRCLFPVTRDPSRVLQRCVACTCLYSGTCPALFLLRPRVLTFLLCVRWRVLVRCVVAPRHHDDERFIRPGLCVGNGRTNGSRTTEAYTPSQKIFSPRRRIRRMGTLVERS